MLQKRSKCFFASSLIVLIVAVTLASWGIPYAIRNQIKKNLQLDQSSMMFENWRNLPVPLKFKVYVFNVTNPEEVNQGEKPKLAEIGPYVYDEYREKIILGYGDNDIIKYNLKKTFIFNQEETGALSIDDEITVINFSYMGAILTVQEMMPGALPMINGALEIFFEDLRDPFLRVKVKDLFFDGIFLNCNGSNTALSLLCGKIRADTPAVMRVAEDRKGFYFSMFNHLNRTITGPFEIKRGIDNINDLGQIISYKNKTTMDVWDDEYCGKMNGSDASLYPPFFGNKFPERLYAYEPEICRSIYASLVGKRELFNITTVYYEISESVLAARSANPENMCFCKRDWSMNHDACLLMGVLSLEPCQGAPAIVSLPHFYLASEELLDFIEEGLTPDKEKHNTFVYLDATTGIVLWGLRRMQFNIELRNIKSIPQLENVPTGLFPMVWIEEGAKIPDNLVADLLYSHKILSYVDLFRWILLAIGILSTIISAFVIVKTGKLPVPWQRNSNSVSFVMAGNLDSGKMHM